MVLPQYNIEFRARDRLAESLPVDAPDQNGLRVEVARFLGEILKDQADEIWLDRHWRLDVVSAEGLVLFVIELMVTDPTESASVRAP